MPGTMVSSDVAAAPDTELRGEPSSLNERQETRRGVWARIALEVLIVVNAVAFLAASVIHFGYSIPLGFTTLADATILQAATAEGVIGVAFVVAATAVFARSTWAWGATLVAYLLAVIGVLIGLSVSVGDPDLSSSANFWFHLTILPLVVVGLVLLVARSGRAGLGKASAAPKVSP